MFKGTVKIALSAPLKWEDREIKTVDLDFSKVRGDTVVMCQKETFGSQNFSAVAPGLSSEYCSRLAAKISGVSYRALLKLPAEDFDAVWQTVGAWVGKRDPRKFYDQFTAGDDDDETEDREDGGEGFTKPAAKPEKTEK